MKKCIYYQAKVERSKAWFFVGILRSYDHLVFERTVCKESSTFEFFVPTDLNVYFLDLMSYFEKNHIIRDLISLNQSRDNTIASDIVSPTD